MTGVVSSGGGGEYVPDSVREKSTRQRIECRLVFTPHLASSLPPVKGEPDEHMLLVGQVAYENSTVQRRSVCVRLESERFEMNIGGGVWWSGRC